MKSFTRVDILEAQLESMIQLHPELLEPELRYVDHQKKMTGGRLDVLLVDKGTFVVAELKIVQDDGMLIQGLDYYDYVSTNIDAFARLYKHHHVDPTKPVRLILVAPSFSQALVNRCKWIDAPITLFTFQCLKFEGDNDVLPIFTEQTLPTQPPVLTFVTLDDIFNYITDAEVHAEARSLIDEIKGWNPSITVEAIKGALSLKVNNRVFAYFHPRRKNYLISTYSSNDQWTDFPVKSNEDLVMTKAIVRAAMERRAL